MNKYKLNKDNFIKIGDKTLYQIISLAGNTAGGYIEDESCLSQEGSCWVDKFSIVTKGSIIKGDAQVIDSIINGSFVIEGMTQVINSTLKGHGDIGDGTILNNCYVDGSLNTSVLVNINNVKIQGNLSCIGDIHIAESTFCIFGSMSICLDLGGINLESVGIAKYGWEFYKELGGNDNTLSITVIREIGATYLDYTYSVKGSICTDKGLMKDLFNISPNVIFIAGLHIHPDKRFQGYGSSVLNELYSNCLPNTVIALEISEFSDVETIGIENLELFYSKNGFKRLKDNIWIKVKE